MLKQTNYLTKVYGLPEGWMLAAYERELKGYQAARKVLTTMSPADAWSMFARSFACMRTSRPTRTFCRVRGLINCWPFRRVPW